MNNVQKSLSKVITTEGFQQNIHSNQIKISILFYHLGYYIFDKTMVLMDN
jgi:hypothetical protein